MTYQRLDLVSPFNDRPCKRTKLNIVRCKRSSNARASHPPNPDHQTTTTISTGVERDGRILLVNPKPKKGISSQLFDVVEKFIHLSGIFAPVHEETPPQPNLLVKGYLPLLMVGPNPKFKPVAGYHWIMYIQYVSRYVRTSRIKQEEYFGEAKFIKIGDLEGLFRLLMGSMYFLRSMSKVLDVSYGWGHSNTSLVYHHGKNLALGESDKPYVLKILEDGDLKTLGMLDFDRRLKHPFTAHPKIDSFTGEMFTFGCFMHDPVPITLAEPTIMHDFAITKNIAIFMDLPLKFRPKNLMTGEQILAFDATKNARFGVLPRYSEDEHDMIWFVLHNCYIFHNANAWEDGDKAVLITFRLKNTDSTSIVYRIANPFDYTSELYEMRFNMKTGLASQKKLSVPYVDLPRVNDKYIRRKQRFVYATTVGKQTWIVKFDMHAEPLLGKKNLEVGGNIKGIYNLEPGNRCSEVVFVSREPGVTSEEDDGYLIFFLCDENTGKSVVNVIDAKTMSMDPVAVVELPKRVPFGFHSFFVTEVSV
ncbi:hypothetical protein MKW98_009894 [Papaver atlanticum]|uniref:carotenoid 9,10-dioxygenase n=1 Tax=Papaver atlanticum TaxID=357466 RepID=A0AAD4T4G7_9MAGN|nr:hypothetical protein MKW98_009894 [Papaver atlanticum]